MPLEISILVASGDPDVADYLQRRVVHWGGHIHCVSRRDQALAALEVRDFHVALVTESLEDGDGVDVIAALRQRQPRLAVYLVAGVRDEQLFQEARRRGATRCIVRPATNAVFEALVEEALEVPESTSAEPRPSPAMSVSPPR